MITERSILAPDRGDVLDANFLDEADVSVLSGHGLCLLSGSREHCPEIDVPP